MDKLTQPCKIAIAIAIMFIFSSSNGFAEWIRTEYPGIPRIYSNHFLQSNPDVGFATGENGLLLRTTNRGVSWSPLFPNVNQDILAIRMIDNNTGYLAGNNGQLRFTTNGWSSNTTINVDLATVTSIDIRDANRIIAAGSNGKISYFNGTIWQNAIINNNIRLNSITFASSVVAYAVGESGKAFRSNNAGESWNEITTGTTATLRSVKFLDEMMGIAVGNGGLILKTTDGGNTWTSKSSKSYANLYSVIVAPNSSKLYAVGDSGVARISNNLGESWLIQVTNTSHNLRSVSFTDANNGHIVGFWGSLLRTTVGGQTLNLDVKMSSPVGGEIYQYNTVIPINWTATGFNNVRLSYSINSGTTWTTITTVAASLGTFNWTAPNVESNNVRIRIENSADAAIFDITPADFSIVNYSLQLTSPIQTDIWNVNSTEKIEWTSDNIANVRLDYSIDNGANWTNITNSTDANTGEFDWNIPNNILLNTETSNARIRIQDAGNANRTHTSQNFTILGAKILSLNVDGMNYKGFEPVNIAWTSRSISNCDLYYSTNGGTNWQLIEFNLPANHSYQWTAINNDAQVIFRVNETGRESLALQSSSINIENVPAALNYPTAGVKYQVGRNMLIEWTNFSLLDVNLDYSIDNGTTWANIITGLDADFEEYSWTIPENSSTNQARIRLTDYYDSNIEYISPAFSIARLDIINPSETLNLPGGSTIDIQWTATNVANIKIEYSPDNGVTNQVLAASVIAALGNFVWTSPLANVPNAMIILTDLTSNNVCDTVRFSVLTPSITVTKPEAGELLLAGRNYEIQWASMFVQNVAIDASLDGGSSWGMSLVASIPASENKFSWTVPNNININNARIRVRSVENPTIFGTTANFAISNDSLRLITPNGAEKYYPFSNTLVRWHSKGVASVNLEYTIDNGTSWISLASNLPNTGSYNWNIPLNPSRNAWFRVTDAIRPQISDMSDNRFTITGVKLLTPSQNAAYMIGEDIEVTWTAVEASLLTIYISYDNGGNWEKISRNYPASMGRFVFTAPANPSTECKIRIIDENNSTYDSQTDGTFSINGIKLISPNGGESLLAGSQTAIEWQSVSVMNVKLEYTIDNGANWITIMADTLAQGGVYNWTVPKENTKLARVRISEIGNPNLAISSRNLFEIRGTGIIITSPLTNQTLEASTLQTISWYSVNVNKINAKYSSDGGKSWVIIEQNIDAELGSLLWTTPNTSSRDFLIKLYDTHNTHLADSTGRFTVFNPALGFEPPAHWKFVTQTGSSAHIIVPTSAQIRIGERNRATGDGIGVFFSRNGEMICGGYGVWQGTNLAITVWGDNNQTNIKDGFDLNETYSIRLWDAQEGIEYPAVASFVSGRTSFFWDTYSVIGSLQTFRELNINLPKQKWSLISSNLIPQNTDIRTMMEGIESGISYMKDDAGAVYFPESNIYDLNTWNITKGYQIYMKDDAVLNIKGTPVNPNGYIYSFNANVWYMIAYLPAEQQNITQVFNGYINNRLHLVKNGAGEIYLPDYGVNTIGTMRPGEGYKLSTKIDTNFRYSSVIVPPIAPIGNQVPFGSPYAKQVEQQFEPTHKATGSSAVYIIENSNFEAGDVVYIQTDNGQIVGMATAEQSYAVLTIWGDNPMTEEIKEGADLNEELTIYHYSVSKDRAIQQEITIIVDKMRATLVANLQYIEDSYWIVGAKESKLSSVENSQVVENELFVYPNPIISSAEIKFFSNSADKVSITLSDVSGAIIKELYSGELNVGENSIQFETNGLVSGIYFIRVQGGETLLNAKIAVQK